MKSFIITLLTFACLVGSSTSTHAQEKLLLENFEAFKIGKINLNGWFVRDKQDALHDVYSIATEGENKYLHADNEGQFVQIFKKRGWTTKYRPYLSWKWRVIKHPEGADSMQKALNDNAAGVYVVFKKSLFSVQTIKYVWAAKGDLEYTPKGRHDHPQIIVRTGDKDLGKWVTEKRNVVNDYERLYGKKPKKVFAFGIITESDSVKVKKAIADYDDFVALKK